MFQKVDQFINKLRWWHLLLALFIMIPLSGWALRQNNLKMLELRDVVVAVDQESGDINEIAPHLESLGNFVLSHMNAGLGGPLELPGSYNAAVEKARQEVEQSGSANAAIYREAQNVCEKPNVLISVRAQCIQNYVLDNAAPGTDAEELEFPPKELFTYNFASPRWSPDLAGFLVLLSALLFLLMIWLLGVRQALPRLDSWVDSDPLE